MAQRSRFGRGRAVALLAAGVVVGAMMLSPAGAHITERVSHVVRHLKETFYTKAQIDRGATGCRGNGSGDAMVKVGSVCIDRYENSIWTARTGGTQITGAIPCAANGQDCKGKIFARSVSGVEPRRSITWYQAQQALANSGKRLPTNAEWQMAVAGTPDTAACNVGPGGSVANTGANTGCISDWGANDMVGNVWEWVADWDEQADNCANYPPDEGSDISCLGDGTPSRFPGALARGGGFPAGTSGGPLAVDARNLPSAAFSGIGFRGAR
jgi:formylglycine-generating enzyme required for sulfatase activity